MKQILENKRGAGKTSPVLLVTILMVGLLMVGGLVYLGMQQSQMGDDDEQMESTGNCNIAPSIDIAYFNADDDKAGTQITGVTEYVIRDGAYIGTKNLSDATFSYGDDIKILASKDDYLDTTIDVNDLRCGSNSITAKMYATSTNSFRIFNTNNQLLADSTDLAGTNQSSSASTISMEVKIDSTTDESTGDLVIVVETNDTEVDSISLSGFGDVTDYDGSVESRSDEFSGSSIEKAFNVPALLDGETLSGTLSLSPESGITIGAQDAGTPVYVTAYSKQAYVEDDGTFQFGIEDSSGDATNEDTWDYDFLIA